MGPILKRIGIGIGLATLLVVAVGFMLPASYTVSRAVTIDADPAHIHTFVGDLERWSAWTPWVKADPTIVVTTGDKTSGIGAHQSWTGDSGGGELTFTRSDPNWGIGYDMSFDDGKYRSQGTMEYKSAGGATEVTWVMRGDNGKNPFSRYFGLMMDPMVGPMFEDGLNRLKLVAETESPAPEPETTPAPGTAD
jgi:hypothetical protein